MNRIIGVISSQSYTHRDIHGRYITHFKLQVDRTKYIFGEIDVQYISEEEIELKTGEKIITYGKISPHFGCYVTVSTLYKLSIFK